MEFYVNEKWKFSLKKGSSLDVHTGYLWICTWVALFNHQRAAKDVSDHFSIRKDTESLALVCMPAWKLDLDWEGDSLWEQTLPRWAWEGESRPQDPEPSKDTLHTLGFGNIKCRPTCTHARVHKQLLLRRSACFAETNIVGYHSHGLCVFIVGCSSLLIPYSLVWTKYMGLYSFTQVSNFIVIVPRYKQPFIVLCYVHMGNIRTKSLEAQLPLTKH